MSAYENYEESHRNYDLTRLPVGVEQIARALLAEEGQGRNLVLLDAGCGTGMHLAYLASVGIGQGNGPGNINASGELIGLDYSAQGIAQVAEKFANLPVKTPRLLVGDFRRIPLPDASVDVVHVSFAIHHLAHTSESELVSETGKLFSEFARVLKPGGRLMLVTTSRGQLHPRSGSLWYYRYFQDAARALARKFLPQRRLVNLLRQSGFAATRLETVEQTYWTASSLDERGPFDQAWRDGDSLFAYYRERPELLQKRLAGLERAIASGAAQRHIDETRSRTESLKQAYILHATRY